MWRQQHVLGYVALYAFGTVTKMNPDYLNILMVGTMLRYLLALGVVALSKIDRFSSRTRIVKRNPPTPQFEDEQDWDHALLWSVLAFIVVDRATPFFDGALPSLTWSSVKWCLIGHFACVEPLYYVFHRFMHHPSVYQLTHYHHHRSVVTQPVSGTSHPWLENLAYMANFSFSFLVPAAMGVFSYDLVIPYWLAFDLLNMIGHCNYEWMPRWWGSTPLKYVLYTTTHHSLHHTRYRCHYVLFCPLWDYLGGTVHPLTWPLFYEVHAQTDEKYDVVFMVHGHGLKSTLHTGFVDTYLPTVPIKWNGLVDCALLPLMAAITLIGRLFKTSFTMFRCSFDKQVRVGGWCVPRLGMEYVKPSQQSSINEILRLSIREAGERGCSHVGLGALNKARFLNGGGQALLATAEASNVKLVHGNTLTAAVVWHAICKTIPKGSDIAMTGATSSIGEAVIRLLASSYNIHLLTSSEERFEQLRLIDPNVKRLNDVADLHNFKWICLGKAWTVSDSTLNSKLFRESNVLEWAEPKMQSHIRRFCDSYSSIGSLKYNPKRLDLNFCFDQPSCVPACFVALLIHHLEEHTTHEIGPLSEDRMVYEKWLAKAQKYSFEIVC